MFMRATLRFPALLAVAILAFGSCKKKTDESVKAKLTGKWTVTKDAYDANANGTMDAGEITEIDTASGEYILFNSDGTGTIGLNKMNMTMYDHLPMSWTLINGDKDIAITNTLSSSTTIDTIHIESLTASDFEYSAIYNVNGSAVKSWTFTHKY